MTGKLEEKLEREQYLWAALEELQRTVDNLEVMGQSLDYIMQDIESSKLAYDYPEMADPDILREKLADIKESVADIHSQGLDRVASLRETLTNQELE